MADNVSREVRARTMRAVSSVKTGPEMMLRRAMWRRNLRGYRTTVRTLPGVPDIAYPGKRIAIFVDGCYWHGCPQHCRRPSSNQTYWNAKIDRNVARDAATTAALEAQGWTVLRIWEHEINDDLDAVLDRLEPVVRGGDPPFEDDLAPGAFAVDRSVALRLVAESPGPYHVDPDSAERPPDRGR